jgi:hypothetical protein
MTVAGFVVVRRPELNSLVEGRDLVPRLGSIYYSGVDRQRWADVFDEDFYANRVPDEIRTMALALKENTRDFTGLDLCGNVEAASVLLAYSNRHEVSNELIVIRSPGLEEFKGSIEVECQVNWIGYDIVAIGEWSLIGQGVFRNPDYFSAWLPRINPFGLFNDATLLVEYVSAYEKGVADGQAEPTAPRSAGLGILSLEVGMVVL